MNIQWLSQVGASHRAWVQGGVCLRWACGFLGAGAVFVFWGTAGFAQTAPGTPAPGTATKPLKTKAVTSFGVSAEIIEVKRSDVASVLKDIPATGTAAAPVSPYSPADSAALYAAVQRTTRLRAHSIAEYQIKAGTREFKKAGSNSVEIEPSADPDGKTLHANVVVSMDEKKIAAVIVAEDGAPAYVGAAGGSTGGECAAGVCEDSEEVEEESVKYELWWTVGAERAVAWCLRALLAVVLCAGLVMPSAAQDAAGLPPLYAMGESAIREAFTSGRLQLEVTGDARTDAALAVINEVLARIRVVMDAATTDLSAIDQQSVFDPDVLRKLDTIEGEAANRQEALKNLRFRHQQMNIFYFAAEVELQRPPVGDKVAKRIRAAFIKALEIVRNQSDQWFLLRTDAERTELEFLKWFEKNSGTYRMHDGLLIFRTKWNRDEYERLADAVVDVKFKTTAFTDGRRAFKRRPSVSLEK